MLFSSLIFLFGFLPLVILLYYLSPRALKNGVLLICSLLFYAWGGVSYALVLVASIALNFLFAKQISKGRSARKKWLTAGLIFNIILLVSFKYLDFFIMNMNSIQWLITGKSSFEALEIVMPLGISFFTFQQMSMLWDLYRSEPRKIKLVETALYISFFPQLIAGPIVRYHDIIDQIRSRKETIERVNSGIKRFIIGLFKKIVFANTCAVVVDTMLENNIDELTISAAWLGAIAYALQIYFDFSGYSDMAIGLGRMFGFDILENFNFPYIATSIRDFWRRWHISLSTWFRDYVYIPLGGSRAGNSRTYFNLAVVFLLTGFWHGATWSFVFWGAFHGLFLIIERLGFDQVLARAPKFLSWLYTTLIVLIGWVFFRIESFQEAIQFTIKMLGLGSEGYLSAVQFLNTELVGILLLALLVSTPILKQFSERIVKEKGSPAVSVLQNFGLFALFIYAVIIINSGSYNPFIYFRF